MEFQAWLEEQYRAASDAELLERRDQVIALIDGGVDIPAELLRAESDAISAEFARRNEAGALRELTLREVAGGAGRVLSVSEVTPATVIDDPMDTPEYNRAFMEFVCRSTPIPMEMRQQFPRVNMRADAITTTSDASAVIPTTLMNNIIMEADTYGEIWSRVRKLNIQGGVEVPILSLKPGATWIGETETSEEQKLQASTKITFSYYGLECRVAQTLLASVTTLQSFQALFVTLAVEAMVKALEAGVVSGNGSGKMLGILNDTRVPSGHHLYITETDLGSWQSWYRKIEAAIPLAYGNGQYIMSKPTFDFYLGSTDTAGQPLARVDHGIDGKPVRSFVGKPAILVENTLLPAFSAATDGQAVIIYANLGDYAVNSNLQMQTVKWVDNDTNEIKNKCILICDGKLVDPYGVYILHKDISDAKIETFSVKVSDTDYAGTIDHTNKTVAISVPAGSTITSLPCTFTVSGDANLYVGNSKKSSPFNQAFVSGTAVNMKVKDHSTENTYAVTVTVAAS